MTVDTEEGRRPRPNILLLFPDQHRGDWLSFRNQTGLCMPHLDALAEQGTAFVNAITPSPICSPARACFATGRNYDSQLVRRNSDDIQVAEPNVYRALRDSGYTTMACGKFDLLKASKDWGSDGRHVQTDGHCLLEGLGFTDGIDNAGKRDFVTAWELGRAEPYQEFLVSRGLLEMHLADFSHRKTQDNANYTNTVPTPIPDSAYCDNWIADNGLALLAAAASDRPWFLQVNFNGPHEPMDITQGMWDQTRDIEVEPPRGAVDLPMDRHLEIRRNYAAMLQNIDRQIGRFVQMLKETGQADNTIIVYSSDHGDMLGDRNRFHKMMPFEPSINVPLVVSGPGVTSGISRATVSLVDLTASIIEWTGASLAGLQGSPLDRADSTPRVTGLCCWRALRGERFKYVHNFREDMLWAEIHAAEWDPSLEAPHVLYDLENDPHEQVNIAAQNEELCVKLALELRQFTGA